MKSETLSYFFPSEQSAKLFEELLQLEAKGQNIGFTYPKTSTHTCFNSQQEEKLSRIIVPYVAHGLELEMATYYRGNLSGEDFGLSTFRQPIVQWCPVPIASLRQRTIFDKDEPWGVTMDGQLAIATTLRDAIFREVRGLERTGTDPSGSFDSYKIMGPEIKGAGTLASEEYPISVNSNDLTPTADIWKHPNGAILCSQRFARLLNKSWDGFPDVKFQPVICNGFSNDSHRLFMKPIVERGNRIDLSQPRRALESHLGVRLPEAYIRFLQEHSPRLPHGWLSISGGLDSTLMKVMKSEHEDSEPAMPLNLIPIFAYGDGDYLCFQKSADQEAPLKIVDWHHDSGAVAESTDKPF